MTALALLVYSKDGNFANSETKFQTKGSKYPEILRTSYVSGPFLGRSGDVELLQAVAVLPQRPHHLVVGASPEREDGEQGRVPGRDEQNLVFSHLLANL